MYGFWQFILMHPEMEFWQSDLITWLVFGMAGSIGWIWGLLTSWIVSRDLPWLSVAISLLVAGLLALLSGFLGFLMTTAWSGSGITVMLLVAIVVAFAWAILINPYLSFKRQRDYRSDRTGKTPQELTDQEIEAVLTPKEISARSLGKLEFRGWREAELTLPITREQVYLVQRIDSSASVCAHCKSYAVDVSEQTVERAIESPKNNKNSKKSDRQQKEKITSMRLVKQTVYSCHFCGCVFAYDQRESAIIATSDSNNYSSNDSSYSSSSNDSSSYDSSYSSDYGSSSNDFGGNFGGGSSDGGGAGSDW
jgi:uncharacterized membrane protein YgcG